MLTLNMGVVDIPYVAYEPPAKQRARVGKSRKAPAVRHSAGTLTTGDVATILEDKYHIMELFFESKAQLIGDDLASGLTGAMEDMLLGAPPRSPETLFAGTESLIDSLFRDFLSLKELDGLGIPGVPTKASLDGVNHRLKRKRGPVRPSFIDTGLYQNAFKAEIR